MPYKTVVFKDTNGDWSYAHLNEAGEPWIHGEAHEKKGDAIVAAQLAYPAWEVEVVDENPWILEVEIEPQPEIPSEALPA